MATRAHFRSQKRLAPHGQLPLIPTAIGALGVVFGDIGTSPLYALKECFDPAHGIAHTDANLLGILSLIVWSLILVVVVKYLIFILNADNRGEGGIMALLALLIGKAMGSESLQSPNPSVALSKAIPAPAQIHRTGYRATMITFMGLTGAALLYGDGLITPAISVLSAIEGLKVATPAFEPFVVPLTVGILIALFMIQSRGTASIGSIFGPATLLWFIAIAAVAVPWIIRQPRVFEAFDPRLGIQFFVDNGMIGFLILSSVVLVITGGEALYADMGHFGRRPIQFAWFTIVFPALITNYFGQAALILEKGEAALHNPFYGLVEGPLLYPMVVLATIATVIASQALISGAYSLTQQAVQLGYLPRVTIHHTSRSTEGQIYVPRVNSFLMIGSIALVIAFEESSRLAAAYGIAVTGTMISTSLLFYFFLRYNWNWSRWRAMPLVGSFLIIDVAFFTANATKLMHGGWVPILIGSAIFITMTTWKKGREILGRRMLEFAQPIEKFFDEVAALKPHRVPGTAVFMTLTRNIAPSVLLHHFRHNQVLHEKVILLSIITKNVPEIEPKDRIKVTALPQGFYKVVAWYGYMETPDIADILNRCRDFDLKVDSDHLSYYLGRETFVTSGESPMASWRKRLFVLMSKNARTATEFFRIPPDQVIEIGSQIRI